MSQALYIICGPTASGKTAESLEWASANNAEIVSCDAVQVYRGMDIGSAKPSAEERDRVPHHCIDLVPATKGYDVSRYVDAARLAVHDILDRGRNVLVVGGSGFYLKSFFEPVADAVVVSEELSGKVEQIFDEEGIPGLVERLRDLNPDGLGRLDLLNPRRLTRALERCLASGQTLAELQAAFEALPKPYPGFEKRIRVLDPPVERLNEKIDLRTKKMLQDGLLEEVRRLDAAGIRQNPVAASAIGYSQALSWLDDGADDLGILQESITVATRQLARKQRTWLRNQLSDAQKDQKF